MKYAFDLIFESLSRPSLAFDFMYYFSQSFAEPWNEKWACFLCWMYLFITFHSVLPRPWIPEIGVLIFLSCCTAFPCVGRVAEGVTVVEWDPFTLVEVQCELDFDISRLKWWRLGFQRCVIPWKAFINHCSKVMQDVLEQALLLSCRGSHLSPTVFITGSSTEEAVAREVCFWRCVLWLKW